MVGREPLGAYVGGLGPLLGPMLAVLGRLKAKSGPNLSGEAIWQADQGREVAQTRAGRPFWGGHGNPVFSGAGPSCRFFSVDYIA